MNQSSPGFNIVDMRKTIRWYEETLGYNCVFKVDSETQPPYAVVARESVNIHLRLTDNTSLAGSGFCYIVTQNVDELTKAVTDQPTFSRTVFVHGKASLRRFSHSKASNYNAAREQTQPCPQGNSQKRQSGVAAFANGMTIPCKLRLGLSLLADSECWLISDRLSNLQLKQAGAQFTREIEDSKYGMRDFVIEDIEGNEISFGQRI